MSSFNPKATGQRVEQLLEAMHKTRCRWNAQLHQALLSALRTLLPLQNDSGEPMAIKNLYTSATLKSELACALPPELCSGHRIVETVKNLMYAGAFVDKHGQVIANVHGVPTSISENTEALKAGLIKQALRRARAVEGGLSSADAKPLALIVFGKGRPDFLDLTHRIKEAMDTDPSLQ